MFIVSGNKLKSRAGGQRIPASRPKDLLDGDIKYGTDFRSVYATLAAGLVEDANFDADRSHFGAAIQYTAVDWPGGLEHVDIGRFFVAANY